MQRHEADVAQGVAQRLADAVAGGGPPRAPLGQQGQRPAVDRDVLRRAERVERREVRRDPGHRRRGGGDPRVDAPPGEEHRRADEQLRRHEPRLAPAPAADVRGVDEGRPQELEGERQARQRQQRLLRVRRAARQQERHGAAQPHGDALQRVEREEQAGGAQIPGGVIGLAHRFLLAHAGGSHVLAASPRLAHRYAASLGFSVCL